MSTAIAATAVSVDEQYLALHAASAGEKVLRLREPRRVIDLIQGGVLAERTTEVRRHLQRGETLFIRLE